MATVTTQISNGPGLSELVDALKYAFNKRNPHSIELTLHARVPGRLSMTQVTKFKVLGLTYESGVDGMFVLDVQDVNGTRAKGFYNANRRKGTLTIK